MGFLERAGFSAQQSSGEADVEKNFFDLFYILS